MVTIRMWGESSVPVGRDVPLVLRTFAAGGSASLSRFDPPYKNEVRVRCLPSTITRDVIGGSKLSSQFVQRASEPSNHFIGVARGQYQRRGEGDHVLNRSGNQSFTEHVAIQSSGHRFARIKRNFVGFVFD